MIEPISDNQKSKYLDTFKDPFTKSGVYKIEMVIKKKFLKDEIEFVATVWFKSGDTRGNHDLKAPDFPTLCDMVHEYTTNLKA
jgi:hypothetical protein